MGRERTNRTSERMKDDGERVKEGGKEEEGRRGVCSFGLIMIQCRKVPLSLHKLVGERVLMGGREEGKEGGGKAGERGGEACRLEGGEGREKANEWRSKERQRRAAAGSLRGFFSYITPR